MSHLRHLALAVALAAPATAHDVLLTITGTVRSVSPNPPPAGPFAGTVPNDQVTVQVALEFPFPSPSGGSTAIYWEFDPTQSSLGVGAVNEALYLTRLTVQDHPLLDRLRLEGVVGSSHLRCVIDDPSGAWLASTDLLGLFGTSSLAGLQVVEFQLFGNGLELVFDPRGISVALATVGSTVCPAPAANSTGAFGSLTAFGSTVVTEGSLNLRASSLPPGALGLFLCSRTPGPATVPGFPYPLCLGGAIGRFVSLAGPADASGSFTATLDLRSFPQPMQPVAVQPGETWYFQAWHRDQFGGGAPTFNFTNAVGVTFH